MRRGAIAAVLSVLGHAALVVAAVAWLRGKPAVPRQAARVSFGVEAVAAPEPEEKEQPVNRQQATGNGEVPERRPPRPARTARSRVKAPPPAAVAETESEADTEAESGSGTSRFPVPGSPFPVAPSGAGSSAPASSASPAAPDPEAVRSAIERAASYPRIAKRQGLEGRVIVRFRIDPSGMPQELQVVTSCGAILDDAAREAVARAAPYAPAPGWVRVPVDFSLRRAR